MVNYSWAYRRYGARPTPWEQYAQVSGSHVSELFEHETRGRSNPPGRALDLGCGRGTYTRFLATHGWQAVGIDAAPEAIEAAQQRADQGVEYRLGDVTALAEAELGTFDLFVDIGCFQGLNEPQRLAMGRSVTELANPGATLLMLAFGMTPLRALIEGVSQDEIEEALPAWEMQSVWPAATAGLGWPMDRTSPRWYRMELSETS